MPSKFAEPETQLTSEQADQALNQAIGSTTPKFQEANELMPTPDMLGAMTLDPTDPKNFSLSAGSSQYFLYYASIGNPGGGTGLSLPSCALASSMCCCNGGTITGF